MKPQRLYPDRLPAIKIILYCVPLVGIGAYLGVTAHWFGFLAAGFFGLGMLAGIVKLIPNGTYLELDEKGFTYCISFRHFTIKWSDITGFVVINIPHGMSSTKVVGYNLVPEYNKKRWGHRLASAIANCDSYLPENYGQSAEELCSVMTSYLLNENGEQDGPAPDGADQ